MTQLFGDGSRGESPLPRSYLYVPGIAGDRLLKAASRGADAVIVDWEDSVPVDAKHRAREVTGAWLADTGGVAGPLWIRVNSGHERETDLRSAATFPALTGVLLAKVVGPEDVSRAADVLDSVGRSDLLICPLIETASALQNVAAIASHPRTYRLHVGEYDLGADLGVAVTDSSSVLMWARATILTASAAAGLVPPVGPVSNEILDVESFRASTRTLAAQGYVGRACIHPRQVAIANELLAPDAESIAEANLLIAAYERAQREGAAVFVDDQGRMVDMAVVRNAQRTLDVCQAAHA